MRVHAGSSSRSRPPGRWRPCMQDGEEGMNAWGVRGEYSQQAKQAGYQQCDTADL